MPTGQSQARLKLQYRYVVGELAQIDDLATGRTLWRLDATNDDHSPTRETVAGGAAVHAIPISALDGDNVIAPSVRTPWFDGPSLLEHLETVPVDRDVCDGPLRFPVQLVVRGVQKHLLHRRRKRGVGHAVAQQQARQRAQHVQGRGQNDGGAGGHEKRTGARWVSGSGRDCHLVDAWKFRGILSHLSVG